jgi:NitT/TauT family transport system substrate-binding protein
MKSIYPVVRLLFLGGLLLALLLTGCDKSSAPQPLSKPLVWGGPKNISMLPIIADKKGFFKEEGLDVRPNYVQTGKIAMDAVVSGDLNFGVIVDVNIGFVKFQQGADIKVVSSIAEKYDDAIVARRDQGIGKPEDLQGKTLAMLTGTTSHRFADLFIDFYKLDRNKITLLNLTPPSIQASVINGQIPAGSVWQPFRYNVQQALGDKAIQFNDRRIYKCNCLLAVRGDFAQNNPAQIRSFLKALIKADQFVKEHKEESIAILAQEIAMDPKVLTAVWGEYVLGVKLDLSLVQTFADTGAWVVSSQQGFENKVVPSYQDVLDPGFLRQVDPKLVIPTGK